MNVWKERIQKLHIPLFLQALLMNVLLFFLLLLFFEPTPKCDDYEMTLSLYGANNGTYSPFLMYSNILLGYVIQFLLMIWPEVSWFYILQFAGMIVSFGMLTYVLMKRGVWQKYQPYLIVLWLLAGYEFYIRMTFTKTAGLMIIAGLSLLLFLIEEESNAIASYAIGLAMILMGNMFRTRLFQMELFVFFSSFIVFLYDNRCDKNKRKRGSFRFVVLVCMISIGCIGIQQLNNKILEGNEKWSQFRDYNSTRGSLVDYPLDDAAAYEGMKVSKNDIRMWKELHNLYMDSQEFTIDDAQAIRAVYSVKEDKPMGTFLIDTTHKLLQYLAGNFVFWIFVLAAMLLCFTMGATGGWLLMIHFLFCLGAYYYLSYQGRTQHHVDAILFFTGTVILLYDCGYANSRTSKSEQTPWNRVLLLLGLLLGTVLLNFYGDIASSSHVGNRYGMRNSQKEHYQQNYNRLSLLSEDAGSLYLMSTTEENLSYPCFSVFQMIGKGFYHNIYRLWQFGEAPKMEHPPEEYLLAKGNPLKAITDNDRIFYCSAYSRPDDMEIVETYIQEHYNENAKKVLVKKLGDMDIYRFVSKPLSIDTTNAIKVDWEEGPVCYQIKQAKVTDGKLRLEGYAYLSGEDSYAQNIYIEMEDVDSKEKQDFFVVQKESDFGQDKYDGRYASFTAAINLSNVDFSRQKISLLLETEGKLYQISLPEEIVKEERSEE